MDGPSVDKKVATYVAVVLGLIDCMRCTLYNAKSPGKLAHVCSVVYFDLLLSSWLLRYTNCNVAVHRFMFPVQSIPLRSCRTTMALVLQVACLAAGAAVLCVSGDT